MRMRWNRLVPATPWGALALALAATAVAYRPALDAEFLFDDEDGIVRNVRVHGLAEWAQGLSVQAAFSGRPVTELTFAIDAERGGVDARTFHETSLALHLLAGVALFLLGRALARRAGFEDGTGIALAAAAAFALHPIQGEAVAYVSQRAEVLASLLGVLSLLALLAADRARTRPAIVANGAAAFLLYALAVGAKQVAIGVPVLFLLAAATFPEPERPVTTPARARWTRRLALAGPMVALALAQAVVFFGAIEGQGDVGFSVAGLGPVRYLLTQARVLPLYLRLLGWPAGLNIDHDVAASAGLLDPPTTLLGGLLVLGLAAAAAYGLAWARGKAPTSVAAPAVRLASFGFLWFLVLLAPTSSLIPLADVAVEHRLYLACWGLFVGLAGLAALAGSTLLPAARRWALPAAGVAVAAALAVALGLRAQDWSSGVAIWADAAAGSPGKARVFTNLGHVRHGRGDLAGALAAYQRAIALGGPGFITPIAVHNMASAYLALRRLGEAREILHRLDRPEPETVVLLALVELEDGRLEEASRWASTAVLGAPGYPRSHEAAGRVAEARGDLLAARAAFQRAVQLFPSDPNTLLALARLDAKVGDRDAACRSYRRAMAAPGNRFASSWAASEARSLRCP